MAQFPLPKCVSACGEHAEALEPFLDVCIASGFSLGAGKSTDKVFQTSLQFLGDIVSQDGLQSTEEHLESVKHFGDIIDEAGMRRFLGAFG